MDPLLTAMIVLLFLVFVFFGPIILAILMIGKPKKITPFKNVLNIEQYKKFRLIYLIIGFILYVGIIVLFVLSIAIESMSGMITPSLYILFGFDIVYLILSLVIGNSIYKKYHVEEPLPDGAEIIADPLPLESTYSEPMRLPFFNKIARSSIFCPCFFKYASVFLKVL